MYFDIGKTLLTARYNNYVMIKKNLQKAKRVSVTETDRQ